MVLPDENVMKRRCSSFVPQNPKNTACVLTDIFIQLKPEPGYTLVRLFEAKEENMLQWFNCCPGLRNQALWSVLRMV